MRRRRLGVLRRQRRLRIAALCLLAAAIVVTACAIALGGWSWLTALSVLAIVASMVIGMAGYRIECAIREERRER